MRVTHILLFLFVTCVRYASAQDNQEAPSLRQMLVHSWAGKNGLFSNNITDIIQTEDGFLWMTSYSGILKFDGHSTQLFDQTQLDFLTTDGFRRLYQSPFSGDLYFASQGDGLVKYSDGEFTAVTATNDDIPKSIECLWFENENEILVGTNNEGLFKISNDSISTYGPSILEGNTILNFIKDSKGTMWLATEGNGLIALKSDTTLHYNVSNGLPSNTVNTVTEIENSIYIGTQAGLCMLKDGRIEKLSFMASEAINIIFHDSNNVLWLGADNGLGRINFNNNVKQFIANHENTSLTRVNAIIKDHENSLWLATGRDGLIQMRNSAISNYTTFDGLSSNKVNIVTETHDKQGYYIGCDDGNVFKLKSGTIQPVRTNKKLSPTGIRDILEEADGTLWVASYRGVLMKKGTEEKIYQFEDGMPALDVRRIHKDRNGAIWFATRSGGLAKIENKKITTVIDKTSELQSNFILSLEEDNSGNLYIGTHSGGLSIIKPSGKISNHSFTEDDAGVIIFNTHIDKRGFVWITGNMGLFLFKDGEFHKIQLYNNFRGISYYDWLEDSRGNAWISSNRGIVHIQKSELDKFIENPTLKLKTTLIDQQDGMVNKECTGAVRSLTSSDNKLVFPTIGGVSMLSPKKFVKNNVPPKVYITQLNADELSFKQQGITIPAGKTRYTINFTALSYISPKDITFRYKLENFDSDYTEVNNIRQAEYTNLPPGEYTFHVQATNNDGVWNETGAHYKFYIEAFYYQTMWFYVALSIILLLALYGIYKWRVYGIQQMNLRLKKVNSELDSFVYSASHDLRSPLSSILGLIELTRKDKQNLEAHLDKMRASIKKLDAFISDIIDFSSNERKELTLEKIKLGELINQVLDELELLNLNKQIEIRKNFEDDPFIVSDKRRVTIILRNLISNALKYFDREKDFNYIEIKIDSTPEYTEISIIDNGIGIHKNNLSKIFNMFYRASEASNGAGLGLYIVKEIAEKLEGSITLESVFGEGTTFALTLPTTLKPTQLK